MASIPETQFADHSVAVSSEMTLFCPICGQATPFSFLSTHMNNVHNCRQSQPQQKSVDYSNMYSNQYAQLPWNQASTSSFQQQQTPAPPVFFQPGQFPPMKATAAPPNHQRKRRPLEYHQRRMQAQASYYSSANATLQRISPVAQPQDYAASWKLPNDQQQHRFHQVLPQPSEQLHPTPNSQPYPPGMMAQMQTGQPAQLQGSNRMFRQQVAPPAQQLQYFHPNAGGAVTFAQKQHVTQQTPAQHAYHQPAFRIQQQTITSYPPPAPVGTQQTNLPEQPTVAYRPPSLQFPPTSLPEQQPVAYQQTTQLCTPQGALREPYSAKVVYPPYQQTTPVNWGTPYDAQVSQLRRNGPCCAKSQCVGGCSCATFEPDASAGLTQEETSQRTVKRGQAPLNFSLGTKRIRWDPPPSADHQNDPRHDIRRPMFDGTPLNAFGAPTWVSPTLQPSPEQQETQTLLPQALQGRQQQSQTPASPHVDVEMDISADDDRLLIADSSLSSSVGDGPNTQEQDVNVSEDAGELQTSRTTSSCGTAEVPEVDSADGGVIVKDLGNPLLNAMATIGLLNEPAPVNQSPDFPAPSIDAATMNPFRKLSKQCYFCSHPSPDISEQHHERVHIDDLLRRFLYTRDFVPMSPEHERYLRAVYPLIFQRKVTCSKCEAITAKERTQAPPVQLFITLGEQVQHVGTRHLAHPPGGMAFGALRDAVVRQKNFCFPRLPQAVKEAWEQGVTRSGAEQTSWRTGENWIATLNGAEQVATWNGTEQIATRNGAEQIAVWPSVDQPITRNSVDHIRTKTRVDQNATRTETNQIRMRTGVDLGTTSASQPMQTHPGGSNQSIQQTASEPSTSRTMPEHMPAPTDQSTDGARLAAHSSGHVSATVDEYAIPNDESNEALDSSTSSRHSDKADGCNSAKTAAQGEEQELARAERGGRIIDVINNVVDRVRRSSYAVKTGEPASSSGKSTSAGTATVNSVSDTEWRPSSHSNLMRLINDHSNNSDDESLRRLMLTATTDAPQPTNSFSEFDAALGQPSQHINDSYDDGPIEFKPDLALLKLNSSVTNQPQRSQNATPQPPVLGSTAACEPSATELRGVRKRSLSTMSNADEENTNNESVSAANSVTSAKIHVTPDTVLNAETDASTCTINSDTVISTTAADDANADTIVSQIAVDDVNTDTDDRTIAADDINADNAVSTITADGVNAASTVNVTTSDDVSNNVGIVNVEAVEKSPSRYSTTVSLLDALDLCDGGLLTFDDGHRAADYGLTRSGSLADVWTAEVTLSGGVWHGVGQDTPTPLRNQSNDHDYLLPANTIQVCR